MRVTAAGDADLDAILVMQHKYQFSQLNDEQRANGFLSAAFSRQQLQHMSADLGIDIARVNGALAGYLCAFRCSDLPRPPIIESMLDAFADCPFGGRTLDTNRTYIYGPVCIDTAYRGVGIIEALSQSQRQRLARQFDYGAAFVAQDNPRSLRAHTVKLGMVDVGPFQHLGQRYRIVAFNLGAQHG